MFSCCFKAQSRHTGPTQKTTQQNSPKFYHNVSPTDDPYVFKALSMAPAPTTPALSLKCPHKTDGHQQKGQC